MILVADDTSPSPREGVSEDREHATEELITGDSDDPPLSQEAVDAMLESFKS
jgi:hypothetical protein